MGLVAQGGDNMPINSVHTIKNNKPTVKSLCPASDEHAEL